MRDGSSRAPAAGVPEAEADVPGEAWGRHPLWGAPDGHPGSPWSCSCRWGSAPEGCCCVPQSVPLKENVCLTSEPVVHVSAGWCGAGRGGGRGTREELEGQERDRSARRPHAHPMPQVS